MKCSQRQRANRQPKTEVLPPKFKFVEKPVIVNGQPNKHRRVERLRKNLTRALVRIAAVHDDRVKTDPDMFIGTLHVMRQNTKDLSYEELREFKTNPQWFV